MSVSGHYPTQQEADNQISEDRNQDAVPRVNACGNPIQGSIYSDGNEKWAIVQKKRVLRIFISSTIRDMLRVGDKIVEKVETR